MVKKEVSIILKIILWIWLIVYLIFEYQYRSPLIILIAGAISYWCGNECVKQARMIKRSINWAWFWGFGFSLFGFVGYLIYAGHIERKQNKK